MSNSTPVADKAPDKFHPSFWSANTTELFERGAYYAMASFVVIYLGRLGMGKYWPSTLNGLLWTLVYFLPILSGTIADHVGFKKSLALAFVLLTGGYFLMGAPVWVGGAQLAEKAGDAVTSPMWMAVVVAAVPVAVKALPVAAGANSSGMPAGAGGSGTAPGAGLNDSSASSR